MGGGYSSGSGPRKGFAVLVAVVHQSLVAGLQCLGVLDQSVEGHDLGQHLCHPLVGGAVGRRVGDRHAGETFLNQLFHVVERGGTGVFCRVVDGGGTDLTVQQRLNLEISNIGKKS